MVKVSPYLSALLEAVITSCGGGTTTGSLVQAARTVKITNENPDIFHSCSD